MHCNKSQGNGFVFKRVFSWIDVTMGGVDVIRRSHGEFGWTSLATPGYEAFRKRSCIRNGPSSIYCTLGLVEEAPGVLEACLKQACGEEVIQ